MRYPVLTRLFAAMAAAALSGGAALAQSVAGPAAMTTDEVEAYFDNATADAVEIVKSGDPQRLTQWAQKHVADESIFQVTAAFREDDLPKGLMAFTMDKDDILRMGSMFAGPFMQQLDPERYQVRADVVNVVPHGPDAATVHVRWDEQVAMTLPASASAQTQNGKTEASGAADQGAAPTAEGGADAAGAEPTSVSMSAKADCHHLVVREQGQLRMGLSTCTAEAVMK